ncbi:MAG: hypothetical protein ACR2LJ_06225 [Acidimicrobiales bacterium]
MNTVMARVEAATRGLARLATVAAIAGGSAGLVLWWSTVGHAVGRPGHSTVVAVLVLGLCLAPAGWLLNVRAAMLALLGLPAKVSGVVARRGAQLAATRRRPAGAAVPVVEESTGRLATVRTIRTAVRDYGDVTGSWARLGQVLTPTFWVLTGLALLAVPVLVAVAAVAGLMELIT